MASNHGNLEKHRYLPWFKGRYRLHAEVNGTEEKKGKNRDGNGYGNVESGPAGTERGRERRVGEAGVSGGGRGTAGKTGDTSVGHVYLYRTAYKWEVAD